MDSPTRHRRLTELLKNTSVPVSVSKLSMELGVSPRTVHNDLSALRLSGAEIQVVMGRGGGFRLLQSSTRTNTATAYNRNLWSESQLVRDYDRAHPSRQANFVGRTSELARLDSAVNQVLGGSGRLLMLAGEPGIGKTRLSQQFAEVAGARGFRVLWGQCHEDRGAPSFWPWTKVLRTLIDHSMPSESPAVVQHGRSLLAEITPDLRSPESTSFNTTGNEFSEASRFRLFDALSRFLISVSNESPLVIILDDLHWGDESSLKLLEFLASEISDSRILLIGTYRDTDVERRGPLMGSLAGMSRQDLSEHLEIPPLERDNVAQLVKSALVTNHAEHIASSIFEQSDGNALFATEIIRLLADERADSEGSVDSSTTLVAGVKQVIRDRLNRLSHGCARLLDSAAILATEFDLVVLQKILASVELVELLEFIDEAVSNRILERSVDNGVFRFSHGLVREAIIDDLSMSDRFRAHARVAAVLEDHYGDSVGANAAELAFHLGAAGPIADRTKYVHYLLLAGNFALDSYAYSDAVDFFERAISTIRLDPESKRGIDASFGLARSLMTSEDLQQAQRGVDLLENAFSMAVETGDNDRAIKIASTRAPTLAQLTGVVSILERALPMVRNGSAVHGYLLAEYSEHIYFETANAAAANTAADRAVEIAEALDNDDLLAVALAKSVSVATHMADLPRCVETARRAIEIGILAGNDFSVAHAAFHLATKGAALGNVDESKNTLERTRHITLRTGLPGRIEGSQFALEYIAILTGDWDSDEHTHGVPSDNAKQSLRSPQFRAIWSNYTGDYETARSAVDPMVNFAESSSDDPWALLGGVIGGSLLMRFEQDDRYVEFAKLCGERLIAGVKTSELVREATYSALGWIAFGEGDKKRAKEIASYFENGRALPIGSIETWNSGHVLAMLHRVTGENEKALDRFERTAGFLRAAGYRPELALVLVDYAETLLERDSAGDRRLASSLLDEATTTAGTLGMKPVIERAQKLGNRGVDSNNPSGLTDRQVEILGLLATGMSNPQIAECLTISRHTVVRHLANIFAKIGVTNRAEASVFAALNNIK